MHDECICGSPLNSGLLEQEQTRSDQEDEGYLQHFLMIGLKQQYAPAGRGV